MLSAVAASVSAVFILVPAPPLTIGEDKESDDSEAGIEKAGATRAEEVGEKGAESGEREEEKEGVDAEEEEGVKIEAEREREEDVLMLLLRLLLP
mmetsp:Transcript_4541/g.7153  ORF Transcript_4541/g.7153 Transcript_4541/m.7153 type:complete len:95 (-) Transcript_4541:259-543(-)